MKAENNIPERIRVSLGSAIVLDLSSGPLDVPPTTAYLLTYREEKCTANCGFCPQARSSDGRSDMLSRVSWPVFLVSQVIEGLEHAVNRGRIRRVCLQALNYPEVFGHILNVVEEIKSQVGVPVSVSCQPLNRDNLKRLSEAGVERIGIPLDAATEQIFDRVKGPLAGGPYVWREQFRVLREAIEVFGNDMVSTHLIVGLGETEREMVNTIQRCVDMGVLPALFAFTPIPGTSLEGLSQPPVPVYRRVQMARHLISNGIARSDDLRFDADGRISGFSGVDQKVLRKIIKTGEPFLTTGCPNCNRPFYNEKPSGPIYNYPRPLTADEKNRILHNLISS